jgi:nucleoside phosphorylase
MVAFVNQVPLTRFRSLSDLAGRCAGRNKIWTFSQPAADNSFNFTH